MKPFKTIAIFSSAVQLVATAVLPFLRPELQRIFVWFLIGFPSLLVVLFFLTLNFNHRAIWRSI
jgi:hypothetical protein